jgi:hypothetical protein
MPVRESTAIASRMRRASLATRASLAASTISLLMEMSGTPPSASASPSLSF